MLEDILSSYLLYHRTHDDFTSLNNEPHICMGGLYLFILKHLKVHGVFFFVGGGDN